MAVSQAQIVDLLYKEAFGVTKTDTATNKSPSNESIPSPSLIRGDTQWTQSDQIPATAAALAGVVQAYTGASAVQTVADNTTVPIGGIYPTWKTNLIYWIPSEFGATYNVQVWIDSPGVANPTSTGTQIFADGSGGTGQYYYNYQSGVLNFIGETIPTALTSGKVLYIVGYRYIGLVGVTNLPSDTTIGNLNINGTTIISTTANSNIILTPDGSGIVQISSGLTSNANITASFFIGNGSQLTGVAASNAVSAGTVTANAQPNITSVGTLISLDVTGNITGGNANLGNLVTANFFSGDGGLLSNITGANVVGNVTSAITANFANYAGNVTVAGQSNITSVGTLTSLTVSGNGSFGNISTTGASGNITGANVVSANTFSGNLLATSANVNGNLISLNANLGNAASANFFVGDGGFLTNVAAGNSVTAGTVTASAQPNITSVGTLVSLDVTGNLNSGNANLGNLVIANFFSGDGSLLGNITGANIVGNVTSAITANFANYAGNVTVNSQPNITSVGTLVSLDITGNLTSGNANLGNAVTASYFIGSGNNLSNIQGSNVTGNVTSAVTANFANFAGNVTEAAQANITSVGTLTSLNVSGNANTGNLGTNNFIATGTGSFGANVNLNTYWINNVGYPNLSTDAATKSYVDTMVSTGIAYHQPVLAATTTTLAIATGGTTAYVEPNGAGNGIGSYISTTGTYVNIDGANVQVLGTRILVKDEANAAWNGVYTYANSSAIVRATDADEYGPDSSEQLSVNDFFFTTSGVVNEGTGFVVSAPLGVITFGTSNITFAIFTTSQVYDAGTGLTLTGTTFSITDTAVTPGSYGNGDNVATFTVNSQGQLTVAANASITANAANLTGTTLASSIVTTSITSTGTLTSLDVTGNIIGGNVYANSGTIGATLITGTLTSSSQPNITSVGTLVSLDITGNLTAGNANLGNSVTANYFTGTLTSSAQPNITSVGTLTGLNVNGDITAANITSNTGVITGNGIGLTDLTGANVTGEVAFANVANNVAGANVSGEVAYAAVANSVTGSNVSGQVSNALISGTVYTNAQPNITSVGTLTSLTVTGNIEGGNLNTGGEVVSTGNGTFSNLIITGSGNISGANNISASTVTGTLTTSSQPNITSVGNLTSLNVVGLSNLGPISNLTITGGTSGYYLQTDGLGGLSWAYVPSGTGITNGTSNVVISALNGNITMSVGGNANIVTITDTSANINGILNVTGNIISTNANLGNAVIASYFIGSGANLINLPAANISGQVANALVASTVYTNAQPNITSVGNLTSLDVIGNITAANANLGNAVTATYFVGNGSLLTGIATATTAAAVANGTSNVNIPAINGNINLSASGNANVLVVTGTGANIEGTANVTGNLIATNIISGGGIGGSITGANLVSANYITGTLTTAAQPNITSTGTLTTLDVSGHLVANTFQMGYGIYAFYSTSVFFATTASTSAGQVLWSYTAADLSAIDFTIIATDATGSTRQTCKISAAILGTTVAFNEYGGLHINGGVGSFSVVYNGSGPTPTLDLIVTPDSANLTEYNMLISKYLV